MRRAWLFLALVLSGLALGVGILLIPAVQGAILRRYLAREARWKLEFERVGAGPTGLDARGLGFKMPGVAASIEPLSVRFAPLRLLSNRELRIEQLQAHQVRVVVTPAELAPSEGYVGALQFLRAPLSWTIENAAIDGEILVRDGNTSRVTGAFKLSGGGLSAENTGKFNYEASADWPIFADGRKSALKSRGTLRIAQSPGNGIRSVTVDGDVSVPTFAGVESLKGKLHAEIKAVDGGEAYSLRLDFAEAGSMQVVAQFDPLASLLTGTASLQVGSAMAPFFKQSKVPQGTLTGVVDFKFDVRSGDFSAKIQGDIAASDWERLMPRLAIFPEITGKVSASVVHRGQSTTVHDLALTLQEKGTLAQVTVSIETPLDVRIPPTDQSINASVSIARLPLQDLAKAFQVEMPLNISDAEFSGAWRLAFDGKQRIQIGPTAPLRVTTSSGEWVEGTIAVDADGQTKTIVADVLLDVDLPNLPGSADTFGALHVKLDTRLRNMSQRIFAAEKLALSVTNGDGERLSVATSQPFLAGLSNESSFVVSTMAPIRVKVGALPLEWFQPMMKAGRVRGRLAPFEFDFSSAINDYALQAVTPVHVEALTLENQAGPALSDANFTSVPSAKFTFILHVQPQQEVAYSGRFHAEKLSLGTGGATALSGDVDIGFLGNKTRILPQAVVAYLNADLAELARFKPTSLPRVGQLSLDVDGDLLGAQPVDVKAHLGGLVAPSDSRPLPDVDVHLNGRLSSEDVLNGHVAVTVATSPQVSDAQFDVKMNLVQSELNITSALHSRFLDGASLLALTQAFPAQLRSPSKSVKAVAKSGPQPPSQLPFWGELRGSFDLDLAAVTFAPYRIDQVRGRLDATADSVTLHHLHGEMFAGEWSGGFRIQHLPTTDFDQHVLEGEFDIHQFQSSRVVQMMFPNQLASVDAAINLHAAIESHGQSLPELLERFSAEFAITGEHGVLRLAVPKADTLSTAAVFGGTILLSPELRALGRLIRKFAEMPIDRVRIHGRKFETGEIAVDEMLLATSQLRLNGSGKIPEDHATPLINRPLALTLNLSAKEEVGVILAGMRLTEKKPAADGFFAMRDPVRIGGRVGAPDTAPLFDLFARAVSGSHGTWGVLMRKLQIEVNKRSAPTKK